MAKKGDWVRIHSVVLKADERTAKLPDDTQKCDLEQWTKGFLQEDSAEIGDEVTVETAVGRIVKGTMIDDFPYYTHSYGVFVPELIQIDKQLREEMAEIGGDK
ncbi:MAG: 2-amino-4-oxopentanoate thiolase subunit OrtA [Clostridiales bacterium]|nr:2-amino-4-oxopentanoate thiolase subunit OrtA [Clostridiales bacterium]MDD7035138.1 2-amino-4-oxopentanoate thiolase subunit OrtA [Bacillota bacterium]MDY2920076.1 2-amino-4-oxopentanoate thiolase subunit OrtA [Lentihominibacter sp.]